MIGLFWRNSPARFTKLCLPAPRPALEKSCAVAFVAIGAVLHCCFCSRQGKPGRAARAGLLGPAFVASL